MHAHTPTPGLAQLTAAGPQALLASASTNTATKAARRHWQRGVDLARTAQWPAAARAFRRAADAAPADALHWINLANALRHGGDLEQALAAARRCLALEPDNAVGLRLLADCLGQLHRYEEAVRAHEALQANGVREPDAMLQHGQMLQALRRHRDAIDVLLQTAALKPQMVQAHALLATSFRDLAMQHEAIECLKTVLALDPDNLQALAHVNYERRHVCDWSTLDADVRQLSHRILLQPEGLAKVMTVFSLLSLPLAPELLLKAARSEALAATVNVRPLPAVPVGSRSGRVVLGLLSYDFHEHPVSQLLVEVLETIDRGHFEVVLYASGRDDGSALRQRLMRAADRFIDVRGVSDAQAAQRMRDDGVDLLLDLQGHTRGHRQGILARRPAPVQAAFLGYPGSSGAEFIDYLVSDPLVTPLELAPNYSEQIAQLPLCLQPNGRWRPLPQPMTRAQAGLPEDAFVMCAFNHTYKILPEAFDVWCAVMRDVPNAVLWLKETNGQLHANVRGEAAARGVDAGRIVFAKAVPYAEHFSRLAQADLFVDTWPYNAHTTCADALWAGLPVVTVYGNPYASRVAASVLNAAGLGELAFETAHDYHCAILALAQDPALLATYRAHLNEQRLALPLFDTPRYTREFEALMLRMVQRWRDGLAPEHLPAQA
jgi:predicted O-linked N-acetylglucosamine transferase (SPINDLY family)